MEARLEDAGDADAREPRPGAERRGRPTEGGDEDDLVADPDTQGDLAALRPVAGEGDDASPAIAIGHQLSRALGALMELLVHAIHLKGLELRFVRAL